MVCAPRELSCNESVDATPSSPVVPRPVSVNVPLFDASYQSPTDAGVKFDERPMILYPPLVAVPPAREMFSLPLCPAVFSATIEFCI